MVKRPYIYLAISLFFAIGFLAYWLATNQHFAIADDYALAETPLRGWAWTETIGWISLNCCDTTSYSFECNDSCAYKYLVTVDDEEISSGSKTYKLKGHAWSGNIGWIRFDETDDANCAIAPDTCPAGSNCYAYYDDNNRKLKGWARVCSLNDSSTNYGWIKLSDTGAPAYGVSAISANVTRDNLDWGNLTGYAWNGFQDHTPDPTPERGIGWINFSCTSCGSGNHQVTAQPVTPIINSIVSPNGADSDSARLNWAQVYGASNYEVLRADYVCNNDPTIHCKSDGDCGGSNTCAIDITQGINGFVWIASVDSLSAPAILNYNDNNLSSGSKYTYKLLAKNLLGGANSSEYSYSTSPMRKIQSFDAFGVCRANTSTAYADLRWQIPVAGGLSIDHYDLEYCLSGTNFNIASCVWKLVTPNIAPTQEGSYNKYRFNIVNYPLYDATTALYDEVKNNRKSLTFRLRAVANDSVCQGGTNDDISCGVTDCSFGGGVCNGTVCVGGTNAGDTCDATDCSYGEGFCGPSKGSWAMSKTTQICPPDSSYIEVKPEE